MLIGVASARSGASIRAIRLYETLGIIDTPQRQGKYRVYNAQTVEILRCIKEAQRLGFTLKDILSLRTKGQSGLDTQHFAAAIEDKKSRLVSLASSIQLQMQALEALQLEVTNPKFCERWSRPLVNQ